MTSITQAGPSCVQELGTFLGPQNRTQERCDIYIILQLILRMVNIAAFMGVT